MTSPVDLHTDALAALKTIPHIVTYDGDVADNPPADDRDYVLPYLVLWPSPGHHPAEARSPGCVYGPELDWLMQVTAAGGTITRALQAAHLARQKLAGLLVGNGAGQLLEEQFDIPMQIDRDVTPPRYFVPLFFRTLTA